MLETVQGTFTLLQKDDRWEGFGGEGENWNDCGDRDRWWRVSAHIHEEGR